jgi:hypothetical protein
MPPIAPGRRAEAVALLSIANRPPELRRYARPPPVNPSAAAGQNSGRPSMPLPSVSTLTNSPRSPLPSALLAPTLGGRRLEPAELPCALTLRKKKGIFCLGPCVFP